MRKIRKRKTNRNLIYGIVFSAMLFLTVGYSVLTTSLNFNITAHKNSVTYEVGDQVEVLGLTQTFHVVEVGEDYLKLLCDSAVGFSKFSTYPVNTFEDSEMYRMLNSYTMSWESDIASAGGSTNHYNVYLISKAELDALIDSKDPNLNTGSMFSLDGTGLDWLTNYEWKWDSSTGGYITGFATSTLEWYGSTARLVNLVTYPTTNSAFFMYINYGNSYTYGMDIRPYLTIDIESVKKI